MSFKKKFFIGSLFTTILISPFVYGGDSTIDSFSNPEFTDDKLKKISFFQGYLFYKNYLEDSKDYLDFESILEGIQARYRNESLNLNEKEMIENIDQFQAYFHKKLQAEKLAEASQFLTQLAQQEGVIELEKGKLYIKIIKNGSGLSVKENASPIIIYSAKTLLNGNEYLIYEIDKPKEILLSSTIPGFSRGVTGMKEGEKRWLYIHPDMAYGSTTGKVDPNSLIIFEVEVIKTESCPSDVKKSGS